MLKTIIFIVVIILLFLIPALILRVTYGPSYHLLSGEDCWMPYGTGGWTKHGIPDGLIPQEPSMNISLGVMYIPVLLPSIVTVILLIYYFAKYLRKRDKYAKSNSLTSLNIIGCATLQTKKAQRSAST